MSELEGNLADGDVAKKASILMKSCLGGWERG